MGAIIIDSFPPPPSLFIDYFWLLKGRFMLRYGSSMFLRGHVRSVVLGVELWEGGRECERLKTV